MALIENGGAGPGAGPDDAAAIGSDAPWNSPAALTVSQTAVAEPIIVANGLWRSTDPNAYQGSLEPDVTHLREVEASGIARYDDARWSGALDVIPTHHYGANSAWQQLSILAHNLIRSFQLDTIAVPKPRSRKRTYTYLIRSMRTLRFLLVTRAGRLARIGGRHVLRLAHNPATEALYAAIDDRLAA